jgi:hypothetical protein
MKKNPLNGSQFKVDYFNSVTTFAMILIITVGITMPLSGDGFFMLLKQSWFYVPLLGTFGAVAFLFVMIKSVTYKLDKHWRWEESFGIRICLQVLLACIVPTVIIASASWFFFNALNSSVILAMFTWSMFFILLVIAVFINVSYILYYFYRFVSHLVYMQKQRQEMEQAIDFILVPNGRGKMKIRLGEIAYIFIEDDMVFLRTLSGINYPLEQSLDEIANTLDESQFIKISRSFIISYASYISWKEYPTKRMLLTLSPPANLPVIVSRRKMTSTKKWIEKKLALEMGQDGSPG